MKQYFYQGVERLSFIGDSPTPTGCLLAMAAGALSVLALYARGSLLWRFSICGFGILTFLLALSFSRGAIIGLSAAIALTLLTKRSTWIRTSLLLLMFASALGLPHKSAARVMSISRPGDDNAVINRLEIWRGTCQLIFDQFPRGVGMQSVGSWYQAWYAEREFQSELRTAVSTPLSIYAGTGVFGMASYSFFAGFGILASLYGMRVNGDLVSGSLGAVQIAFHGSGIFATIEHPILWAIVFVAFVIACSRFWRRNSGPAFRRVVAVSFCFITFSVISPPAFAVMYDHPLNVSWVRDAQGNNKAVVISGSKSKTRVIYIREVSAVDSPGPDLIFVRALIRSDAVIAIVDANEPAEKRISHLNECAFLRRFDLGGLIVFASGDQIADALSFASELVNKGQNVDCILLQKGADSRFYDRCATLFESAGRPQFQFCVTSIHEMREPSFKLVINRLRRAGVDFGPILLLRNDGVLKEVPSID